MNTVNDTIAHSLTDSQGLLNRYIADLTPAEYLHRPTPKANCAAWIIGHLVLSDRRGLATLGVKDLPALPDGFEKRYSRDPGAAEASDFGDVTILPKTFDDNRKLLIESVMKASPETLNAPMATPHPRFKTPGQMLNFYSLHTAMHAGQITYIRRSLGRPPIV